MPEPLSVFLFASITALATGLGALPLWFVDEVPDRWLGRGDAAAGGLMLAASIQLVSEGYAEHAPRTALGVLVGVVFIALVQWWLDRHHGALELGQLEGADATGALLILAVMTAHSMAEGISVGVAFGGERDFGLFITAAIAVHNIPEGLAISLALVPRGMKVWKAAGWSVLTSAPQPVLAVPAFLFVQAFEPALPAGLGFAAGAMIWMVAGELLPDALEELSPPEAATILSLALAIMLGLQVILSGGG